MPHRSKPRPVPELQVTRAERLAFGRGMRMAREALGLPLVEVAVALNISLGQLEQLERGELERTREQFRQAAWWLVYLLGDGWLEPGSAGEYR
jgi:transcriptional regulator with XRE-family HTH domain